MPRLALSPNYRLFIETNHEDHDEALTTAFAKGSGTGLLYLDTATEAYTEEPAFAYWKDFARLFLSLFSSIEHLDQKDLSSAIKIELPMEDCTRFLAMAPPMKGFEYICEESLKSLWQDIGEGLTTDIIRSGEPLHDYFNKKRSSVSLLGRVCFHLAENKKSPESPFAFLATYAHQVALDGTTKHVPLSRALEEYAGSHQKNVLLRLLSPIQKASTESNLIRNLSSSGAIFQTLAWNPKEAYNFLKDIPIFERSGIAVRVPNWWKAKKPQRPQVSIKLGENNLSLVGLNSLVDFSLSVVIGDEDLTQKEITELLKSSENLIFFKGQWIEVDREKLGDLLSKWKSASKSIGDGVSFGEAMRMLSGVASGIGGQTTDVEDPYVRVVLGDWLAEVLNQIRSPEMSNQLESSLKKHLKANLRPYQRQGVTWLYQLNQMRLGAILADDMGLGKTIQILSLLLLIRDLTPKQSRSLLVVPASLIGNWQNEIRKFAPSLEFFVAHPSGDGYDRPKSKNLDLVITTYGSLAKITWILESTWSVIIADEAQAIKNPSAKQTKTLKTLKASHRIALTGTPVENNISDLWSLFDFISPGLLGTAKEFESLIKKMTKTSQGAFAPIRRLIGPYILRRLKTDKKVIQDLPDKTEIKSYCYLSKGQAALYLKSVETLAADISMAEGIKRRGIVLAYLMRFKQICNHPSQFVKDGRFELKDSGKFQRLREICEVIADKQEKVLVFTQFKEMTEPLHDILRDIFGKPGLVLHGDTNIKKRAEMVTQFQSDDGPPYFVLSLKAGGTGLTLTAAPHVIHFDRWWNPAVENQATDRAFRIGQKKSVLVHKFICKGTLEEKIDLLIDSKRSLSSELLEDDGGAILTELSNEELLNLVSLDINSASLDV